MGSKILSADEILSADDLKRETVPCPEWGGDVLMQELTGADRDAFEVDTMATNARGEAQTDFTNYRAKLVGRCAIDEEGNRLFTDEQVAALGRKSGRALDRCFAAARRLNALSDADLEELAGKS